jgi:hypothetical protein
VLPINPDTSLELLHKVSKFTCIVIGTGNAFAADDF